jgi:glutamyl-Q tRNA(Asp) synthetase
MGEGQSYAWRLDAEKARRISGALFFTDHNHGVIPVNYALLGDVIIARKDIGASYHLAVVCDDAAQQVTHVLQLPQPNYIHHALIHDEAGKRLAKRHDALSLKKMRADGMTPKEVFALLHVYAKK